MTSVLALTQLRWSALLEGVSFLLLLAAVPFKHLYDQPAGVRLLGPLHGLLFVLFVAALVRAASMQKWPLSRSVLAFLSSLVPFGTFVLDVSLKREIAALANAPTAEAA